MEYIKEQETAAHKCFQDYRAIVVQRDENFFHSGLARCFRICGILCPVHSGYQVWNAFYQWRLRWLHRKLV